MLILLWKPLALLLCCIAIMDITKAKPQSQPTPDRLEFDRVVHVLSSQYDNLEPSGDAALHHHDVVINAFRRMASKVQRQAYPDPEVRYTTMIAFYKANLEHAYPLPRYRIFTMMKAHLGAILGRAGRGEATQA